ncbi:MAG: D-aminoacylase [Thermomicrobiaceae bacterium]
MVFTLANGTLYDGTGASRVKGNLVVDGDRIVAVGPDVDVTGDVIDVEGLAVAPGFIDMHSHSDLVCMSDPQLAPKLMQGVTLELLGQDGLSEAPIKEDDVPLWRRHLSGLNGDPDLPWGWRSFGEYLTQCDGASTNVAAMVGHGTVRLHAMGMDDRLPSEDELQVMRSLVDEAIQQGAIGFSTGLIYSPCVYSETEEMISIGEIVAQHGSFMVYHMRYEGQEILRGMDEVFRIARESGAACHISHFKAHGMSAWGKSSEMIEAVEKARASGLDITADQYPYTAGSTMLAAVLPPWAHSEGIRTLNRWLGDSLKKDQMRREMLDGRDDWESIVLAAGWDNIRISGVKTEKNAWTVGKSLSEISDGWGIEAFESVVRLLLDEDHEVSMIIFAIDEADVRQLIVQPWLMHCSDGLMGGTPHPRTYGTFARVLGRYARDEGLMPLEQAVHKMTGLSAWRLGLSDRGELKEGNFADIVVFDPDTLIDRATYDTPTLHPAGIERVIVNGVHAVQDGRATGNLPGRVVRRQVAAPGTR